MFLGLFKKPNEYVESRAKGSDNESKNSKNSKGSNASGDAEMKDGKSSNLNNNVVTGDLQVSNSSPLAPPPSPSSPSSNKIKMNLKRPTKKSTRTASSWFHHLKGGRNGSKSSSQGDEENAYTHFQESPNSVINNNPNSQQGILHEVCHWYINRSWKKKLITLLAILSIIPVVADVFVFKTGFIANFIDSFLIWMRDNDGWGIWAYIFMLTLISLVFIPPSILIFASGFIFNDVYGFSQGVPIALIATYLGTIMGGSLGFARADYMARDLIKILMRRYPILRAVDAAIVKNSLRVMILLRLNCLIPFGVLNYSFGITGISWAENVLAMIGCIPWHLWLIYLGATANSVYDDDDEIGLVEVILMSMGIAFGVIGLIILWRFAKKELQKEVDAAPTIEHYRNHNESLKPITSKRMYSIEDSDLYFTDYLRTQYLGEDSNSNNHAYDETSDNHALDGEGIEVGYQSKLGWSEIILDDFS